MKRQVQRSYPMKCCIDILASRLCVAFIVLKMLCQTIVMLESKSLRYYN